MSKLEPLDERSDLVAHIFHSVAHTERVVVTCALGDVSGTLLYSDRPEVRILLAQPLADLPAGSPLCIVYDGSPDGYRFYTELTRIDGKHLVAGLPYALEHSDRRVVERIPLAADSGFAFRPDGREAAGLSFPVRDISIGGFCFAERHDVGREVGDLVPGQLLLPGEPPMPLEVEVRRLQLRKGELQVGTRIHSISVRNRVRLACVLAQLQARAAA